MMGREKMRFGSLFSGIGGFDLGLERAGMECAWQVENNLFGLGVLAKHWPAVQRFEDVHHVGATNLSAVDLIVGGFPCQPFSNAGHARGEDDNRNLWPEMLRVVSELKPRWVVGENVIGLINLYLDSVLTDLEKAGYEAWPLVLPSAAFDTPHQRGRVFILAHSDSERRDTHQVQPGTGHQNASPESEGWVHERASRGRLTQTTGGRTRRVPHADVFRVADGFPSELDKYRLTALGNAVDPRVAEHIGRCILAAERDG
jgi:DNA (cytosine-5)-methyltransferase 1